MASGFLKDLTCVLDRAFQRVRKLADGDFRRVGREEVWLRHDRLYARRATARPEGPPRWLLSAVVHI